MISGDFRSVCSFITSINAAHTVGAVLNDFHHWVDYNGFAGHLIGTVIDTFDLTTWDIYSTRWPLDWGDRYRRDKLQASDPILRFSRYKMVGFSWKAAIDTFEEDIESMRVVQIAAEYGLIDGMCVPIITGGREVGLVSVGGDIPNIGQTDLLLFQLIALHTFNRIKELKDYETPAVSLSKREMEALQWVALGKSAWETAVILDISPQTVNKHIKSARRKLNASNKTEAVAKALDHRLI